MMKIFKGACCILFFFFLFTLAPAQQWAEVKSWQGRPTLFVNGQPSVPDFYALTHAYGGRWSWEEVPARNLKNFAQAGIRLFQVDLYFEDIWLRGKDSLDINRACRQVRGVLDMCPEAGVVIRVHVNAPYWWNEENPEECTSFANGPVDTREYGPPYNNEDGDVERPLRASLASDKWRLQAGLKLQEFCQRLAKTPEGNAVIGLHISGGIYGEWHYWGFIQNDPDTGPAMTNWFRQWLRKKYGQDKNLQLSWKSREFTLETATVPGSVERNLTQAGIFRDPEKEQRVIDYFTCQQEVVADDIGYFCRIAKTSWPRPLLVGVFYGYFHMTFCRQAAGGHLCVERILNCPWIDYLSAPQSYWDNSRRVGGSGNPRGIIESTFLHGKLWLDEMDNGFLQSNTGFNDIRITRTEDTSYVPVLRRNALYPLMRGSGLWYYDFGPQKGFGWWDRPLYLQHIAEEKAFFDQRINSPWKSAADLLVVWDMESFYYMANNWTPICYRQLDESTEDLLRSGISGDHIYLFDLPRVQLDQYKAVLFMNVYKMTEDQRRFIQQKVARNGRTLVWNYLPGYTDGKRLNAAFVTQLTGMKMQFISKPDRPIVQVLSSGKLLSFEGPVSPLAIITEPSVERLGTLAGSDTLLIARKKNNGYTSVWATLPLLGTNNFRRILADAGCHVYNQENDFTYAHSGLLLLHTKDGGDKSLILRNGRKISVHMPPLSSWLLDAETGELLMK